MTTILSPHSTASGSEPAAPAAATSKALWIAVGVLAVVSSALGAALVMKSHDQPAASPVQQASALPTLAPEDGTPVNAKPMVSAQSQPEAQVQAHSQPRSPAPVKHAAPHPAPAATAHQVAQADPTPGPAPRAVCSTCGTVESVQPVTIKGQGSGLGVAGGAVAGGLLGHQMGGGGGKTALTVLGALGGAFAGNEVEKTARATTEYDVRVRMEDGSVRTVRQSQPVAAGTHVHLSNGALSIASN